MKVRLIHYSKDPDFFPRRIETVKGFGTGCFFYPEGSESDGWDRFRSAWTIDEHYVELVQSFDVGELGNDNLIVEVFVRAKFLKFLEED